jgi:hypothetical protein
MLETGLKSIMKDFDGKYFKNLKYEMYLHVSKTIGTVKGVVLCLYMHNNLKITLALV